VGFDRWPIPQSYLEHGFVLKIRLAERTGGKERFVRGMVTSPQKTTAKLSHDFHGTAFEILNMQVISVLALEIVSLICLNSLRLQVLGRSQGLFFRFALVGKLWTCLK
jgi:hypothetical protein